MNNISLKQLEDSWGINFEGVQAQLMDAKARLRWNGNTLACDAQPGLITQSNSGIPAYLSTYMDPKLIEVLVAPMRAAEVAGNERKVGDWTTETAMFPLVESTGQVSSYGDYSNSGQAGVNVNWPQRQAYTYQVVTEWGERELAKAGLARIDWASRVNIASVLTLNKFQNKSYFFGVAGIENYGLLNDPSLSAPISPLNGAWATGTAGHVYQDIQALFSQLQTQANGLVDLSTKMTLVMSPVSEVALTKTDTTNFYGTTVAEVVKKCFPNMRIMTAPEYATNSGNLVQLFADEIEGQRTVDCAFTEKLRAHPIVVALSAFSQKKSQGTWGAVIYRPFLVAQMLGV